MDTDRGRDITLLFDSFVFLYRMREDLDDNIILFLVD